MTNATPEQLARVLALRPLSDYSRDRCVAWLDAADRLCGRDAEAWLCPRHVKVAERRLDAAIAKRKAERAKAAAKRERMRPAREQRLDVIERRLDVIDPLRRDETPDRAAACAPLRQRMPSEARIHELATLHAERTDLRRALDLD